MSQTAIPKIADFEQKTTPLPHLLHIGVQARLAFGLVAVVVVLFLISLAIGSVNIPLDQIVVILMGAEPEKASWANIVVNFRLPRVLTAMLAGAALGTSGLLMQTFFRNPLAGPFILGISSGASLGVAIVVLSAGAVGGTLIAGFGITGDLTLAAAAAIGASITMVMVLFVARKIRNSTTLLILGLMFGYMTSAMVSLLLFWAVPERIQAYINWTFGSFAGVTWSQMQILMPAILFGLLTTATLSKPLNAMLLGEQYAESMGVNLMRIRIIIVLTTAILAGAVTAFCGPIGFIGIAVPHLCRNLFKTSDHRILVVTTVLMGAIVAMISSLIAEVPGSNITLPLNAVTSFLGAPVVVYVIVRQPRLKQ